MNDTELNDLAESTTAVEEDSLSLSPGAKLKQLREELGYSRENVAEALYMTERYVKALEEEEYHILPGITFIKGYYKAYARLLRADVDEIMASYDNHAASIVESQESEAKVIQDRITYDQNKRWLICAALIITIVVAVSWWYGR